MILSKQTPILGLQISNNFFFYLSAWLSANDLHKQYTPASVKHGIPIKEILFVSDCLCLFFVICSTDKQGHHSLKYIIQVKCLKKKVKINSYHVVYRLLLVVGRSFLRRSNCPFFSKSSELFLLCALHSLRVSFSSAVEQVVARAIFITIRETRLSCLFPGCVVFGVSL